ncbi:MAG TPA: hypothetical protein VMR31_10025 [Myxococcota bacterium]|nr:hypothetical protein [Myxococcota bacterium]
MDAAQTTTHTTSRSSSASERRRRAGLALAACALGALAWAGFAPIRADSREALFEIPKGTWARRMAGEKREILPAEIRLTLGVRDVLLLRNLDDVPQIFGPTLLMPGQSFRLPFSQAASYPFTCTAHASGQLLVVVEEEPDTPWARVAWRVRAWWG